MNGILWGIFALSAVGVLNTLYLSYHVITKTDVKCLFFPPEWCQKVQYSPYSRTFGIPNPFLGLLMYVALLVLTLLFGNGVVPIWTIATIIAIGFLFSTYFTYIQSRVLHAFCTWCVVSALVFDALFVLMVLWFILAWN